jgi:hypothetical protein
MIAPTSLFEVRDTNHCLRMTCNQDGDVLNPIVFAAHDLSEVKHRDPRIGLLGYVDFRGQFPLHRFRFRHDFLVHWLIGREKIPVHILSSQQVADRRVLMSLFGPPLIASKNLG